MQELAVLGLAPFLLVALVANIVPPASFLMVRAALDLLSVLQVRGEDLEVALVLAVGGPRALAPGGRFAGGRPALVVPPVAPLLVASPLFLDVVGKAHLQVRGVLLDDLRVRVSLSTRSKW